MNHDAFGRPYSRSAASVFIFALFASCFVGLGIGCKTSQTAPIEPVLSSAPPPCDIEHNGTCVLRKASDEDYEARAEVMAAEAEREASLFSQRLRRWRQEEEARQRRRARTSSITDAQPVADDDSPGPKNDHDLADDPASVSAGASLGDSAGDSRGDSAGDSAREADPGDLRLGMGISFDDEDSKASVYGTSIRALKRASPPAVAASEVGTKPEDSQRAGEAVLRMKSAKCLLLHDRVHVEEAVRAQRASRVDRKKLGELALASVEIQVLIEAIDAELARRKVVQGMVAEVCRQEGVKGYEAVLRPLVGPPASAPRDASRYSRGLVRLRGALERESGLPRSE
ncbi:MAG: hypothetical protein IPK13_13945 [Deltaproteobacteria bacterium]|nr:hypothetical protein [Deltaproteobacteria bacterium]